MAETDRSPLADYIFRRMDDLGIEHQAELARRAGLSTGGLSHILTKGDVLPKPKTIEKLADALGVEPVDLTSRAGYAVDKVQPPDARAMRLARAIEARPWMAARKDQLLSLSQSEFEELMDLAEFRRGRKPKKKQPRKDRLDPDSQ